jgi:glycosyltransferase involved in cell wall biosynthesis
LKLPRWLFGKYNVIYNGLGPDTGVAGQISPPENPVVLAVGTLHPRKGYETLLAAFQRVVAKIPAAECWIVGGEFGDGSYGRKLREMATTLGIAKQVKFLGSSTDVRSYMLASSVLTVPSRIEAFGMVAIEAMLLGKPVVACRTGGLKEIVAHRATGCLVEPENPGEMAKALLEILSNRPLAQTMGEAGQARVQQRFTLTRMTASFAAFYGRLIGQAA